MGAASREKKPDQPTECTGAGREGGRKEGRGETRRDLSPSPGLLEALAAGLRQQVSQLRLQAREAACYFKVSKGAEGVRRGRLRLRPWCPWQAGAGGRGSLVSLLL